MTDAGQTGREGRGSWGRIFCRYPGAVLASILVVLAVVLDFTLTSVWHLIKYGTIHHGVANQNGIHIPSPIYHHTLKPRMGTTTPHGVHEFIGLPGQQHSGGRLEIRSLQDSHDG